MPDDNNINIETQREFTITASSVDLGATIDDDASQATLVAVDNESKSRDFIANMRGLV